MSGRRFVCLLALRLVMTVVIPTALLVISAQRYSVGGWEAAWGAAVGGFLGLHLAGQLVGFLEDLAYWRGWLPVGSGDDHRL